MVIGVIRRTAVTASIKEAQKPVISPKIMSSSFGRPLETLTAQRAMDSKNPDFLTTPMRTIIPAKRPKVLKSINCWSAISWVRSPL